MWTESSSRHRYGHQSPGCSVSTSRRSGCRSNTPENTRMWAARRLNQPPLSIVWRATRSGPVYRAASPAPECEVRGIRAAAAAAQSGSHAAVVVRAQPGPRSREVDALEAGLGRPAQLGHRGADVPHRQVGQAHVAMRRLRAHAGQPAVVQVDPGRGQLGIGRRAQHRRLERDRLVVLAPVEDHLGGDALGVEVVPAGGGIVVAGRPAVPPRRQRAGVAAELGDVPPGRAVRVGHVGVERVQEVLRAQRTEVLEEPGPDVAVRGHQDEGFASSHGSRR